MSQDSVQSAQPDWRALHGSALEGKLCLVTGIAGFIGSHVAEALLALGAGVRGLDDLSEGDEANIPRGVELIRGDIRDEIACRRAMHGCELAFHLAAKVSVPKSVAEPVVYHETNATGTLRLLEAARHAKVRRFIYSASSSAYGDQPELPKHEDMPPRPMSPYAAAKLAAEHYVRAHAAVYDMDAVSLRYFNIFGPRQNANSAYAGVIAAFARDLLAGETPMIYGDGSATRDFTYVANAVHANLLAARHARALDGEVFNVGIGRRISVLELERMMAKLVRDSTGRDSPGPRFAPPRPGDVPHSLADLSRVKALGYEPIVGLEDGLRQTLAWYAQSL